jgi:hypothetical protein
VPLDRVQECGHGGRPIGVGIADRFDGYPVAFIQSLDDLRGVHGPCSNRLQAGVRARSGEDKYVAAERRRSPQEIEAAIGQPAAPGIFSLARKRVSGRAGKDRLGAQRVARVGEAGDDIVMCDAGVVGEDFASIQPSAIRPITNSTDSRCRG